MERAMENYNNLSKDETIRQIEQVYHSRHDPDSASFGVYDQLLACEAIAEAEKEYKEKNNKNPDENVSVNGSVNDTYKRRVIPTLFESKQNAIAELKTCNYRTPPVKIEQLLTLLFVDHASRPGHWLYIAQHWNPRAINRVINQMIKIHRSGAKTIKNASAYFTYLIKFRKKRRSL